jgi:hypothetical protein
LTSLHTWASDTGFQTPGFRQRMDNRVAFSGGLAAGTGTRQCEANMVLKLRSGDAGSRVVGDNSEVHPT